MDKTIDKCSVANVYELFAELSKTKDIFVELDDNPKKRNQLQQLWIYAKENDSTAAPGIHRCFLHFHPEESYITVWPKLKIMTPSELTENTQPDFNDAVHEKIEYAEMTAEEAKQALIKYIDECLENYSKTEMQYKRIVTERKIKNICKEEFDE